MRALRFRRRADGLLAVIDIGVALISALLAFQLRFEGARLPGAYMDRYRWMSLVLAGVWIVAARMVGLYRRSVLRPGSSLLEPAFEAALVTGISVYLLNLVVPGPRLSRGWIALLVLGLLLLGVGARAGLRRLRRMLVPLGIALERYAILGDDLDAERLRADLTRAAGAPFVVTELIPGHLDLEAVAERATTAHLDGLIIPAGHEPADLGRMASLLSGRGIDVLVAPSLGDLDMRVASVASFHGVALLRVAGLSPRRAAIRRGRARPDRGVAILGTRGIPANYVGFETFAERLALHLVDQHIPVTVYCRSHYASGQKEWRGVRLVTLPTIRSKYLDTVVHTLLSVAHMMFTSVREVVLCNAANSVALPVLRLGRRHVIMNVDGLEWRRRKWGVAGRTWYHAGEWMAVRWASVLVTDAEEVRTYYRVRHDADSVMIPYGADLLERGLPLTGAVDVTDDGFFLYVSRWEPENNPVLVAAAHAAADVSVPLVMLGSATYDPELAGQVRAAASERALLPGAVYGEAYRALQANALAYIHATEVGGTHPALIEAMGAGNLCLVLDTPENREVAGPVAWLYRDQAELARLIERAAASEPSDLCRLREETRDFARSRYSWDVIGRQYEALLNAHVR